MTVRSHAPSASAGEYQLFPLSDQDALFRYLDDISAQLRVLARPSRFAFGLLCLERQWVLFVRVVKVAVEYEQDVPAMRRALDLLWNWVSDGAPKGARIAELAATGWDFAGEPAACSGLGLIFTQAVADLVSSVSPLDPEQPARCASRNIEAIENLVQFADLDELDRICGVECQLQQRDIDRLRNPGRTEEFSAWRTEAHANSPFATLGLELT